MSEAPSASASHSRIHFGWLLGVSILAFASGIAWLLTECFEMGWLASWVLAAAVGWVLIRLIRANTKGVVLWCLAVVVASTSFWALLHGTEGWGFCCGLAGLFLSIASCVIFLVAAARDQGRRGTNCACFNLAMFTWIILAIGGSNINRHLEYQEQVRHTTETLAEFHRLDTEIEAIRTRLARLPEDENELVALRGKPMPAFFKEYRIRYRLLDGGRFELEGSLPNFWGHAWDLMGWIVLYHGPDSPQRIKVVTF